MKGKFNFGSKYDGVTLKSEIELPAGLSPAQSQSISVGIGNVTASGTVDSKGRVSGLDNASVKKVQVKWPRLDKANPVTKGGEKKQLWDEVRWEGRPGEQSVWVVVPSSRRPGELYRTELKGVGPIRHFLPYTVTNRGAKYPVARFPLNYLFAHEDEADFWTRRLAPVLELGDGIGVIVAANDGVFKADEAYVIVTHTAEPATFKAVLGWRDRKNDRESPSLDPMLRIRFPR
mgnify:CR=1 FL=1